MHACMLWWFISTPLFCMTHVKIGTTDAKKHAGHWLDQSEEHHGAICKRLLCHKLSHAVEDSLSDLDWTEQEWHMNEAWQRTEAQSVIPMKSCWLATMCTWRSFWDQTQLARLLPDAPGTTQQNWRMHCWACRLYFLQATKAICRPTAPNHWTWQKHHFRTQFQASPSCTVYYIMSETPITHHMKITDRRNTLKTRAFKSKAWRLEEFEKGAAEKFTPFLMHYTLIALTTFSPWKSLCHLAFICLRENSLPTSSASFHTLQALVPLYRLLLLSSLMLTAAI